MTEVDLQQLRFVGLGMIPKAGTDLIKQAADELEVLRKAADEVLKTLMPDFPDSRAVNDCLVALALARSPREVPLSQKELAEANDILFSDKPKTLRYDGNAWIDEKIASASAKGVQP